MNISKEVQRNNSTKGSRPELVRKRSFFSKPQLFEKAKNGLKRAPSIRDIGAKKEAPLSKKTTTTVTTEEIVNGKKVVETTIKTVTEPTVPKGFKGKIMKTIKPVLKTTQVVVTRETSPIDDKNQTTKGNQRRNDSMRQQNGTIPIPAPSEASSHSSLGSIEEVTAKEKSTEHSDSTGSGVVRSSTISEKAFQKIVAKESQPSTEVESALRAPPRDATPARKPHAPLSQNSKSQKELDTATRLAKTEATTTTPESTLGSTVAANGQHATDPVNVKKATKENPSIKNKPVVRKSFQTQAAPAGVPTMFAHAFPATKKRSKTRKQRPSSKGSGSNNRAPLKPLAPVQEGTVAKVEEAVSTDTTSLFHAKGDNQALSTDATGDEESEYDEFTIYDDESSYYYEEETVYSQDSHQIDIPTKALPPSSGPEVKVEGMEMVMANLRLKVPTVH